jgi:hypothetical protein
MHCLLLASICLALIILDSSLPMLTPSTSHSDRISLPDIQARWDALNSPSFDISDGPLARKKVIMFSQVHHHLASASPTPFPSLYLFRTRHSVTRGCSRFVQLQYSGSSYVANLLVLLFGGCGTINDVIHWSTQYSSADELMPPSTPCPGKRWRIYLNDQLHASQSFKFKWLRRS